MSLRWIPHSLWSVVFVPLLFSCGGGGGSGGDTSSTDRIAPTVSLTAPASSSSCRLCNWRSMPRVNAD